MGFCLFIQTSSAVIATIEWAAATTVAGLLGKEMTSVRLYIYERHTIARLKVWPGGIFGDKSFAVLAKEDPWDERISSKYLLANNREDN